MHIQDEDDQEVVIVVEVVVVMTYWVGFDLIGNKRKKKFSTCQITQDDWPLNCLPRVRFLHYDYYCTTTSVAAKGSNKEDQSINRVIGRILY